MKVKISFVDYIVIDIGAQSEDISLEEIEDIIDELVRDVPFNQLVDNYHLC